MPESDLIEPGAVAGGRGRHRRPRRRHRALAGPTLTTGPGTPGPAGDGPAASIGRASDRRKRRCIPGHGCRPRPWGCGLNAVGRVGRTRWPRGAVTGQEHPASTGERIDIRSALAGDPGRQGLDLNGSTRWRGREVADRGGDGRRHPRARWPQALTSSCQIGRATWRRSGNGAMEQAASWPVGHRPSAPRLAQLARRRPRTSCQGPLRGVGLLGLPLSTESSRSSAGAGGDDHAGLSAGDNRSCLTLHRSRRWW